MSKKDKNLTPKKEPKKEMVEESQESKLAKKIIDLETLVTTKDKEIAQRNQIIDTLKSELTAMAQEYKNQMLLKMDEANKILKLKQDENDAKFRANLAEAKKYAIKDQALDLIDVINQFEIACNYQLTDEKLINYQKGFKMFLTKFYKLLEDWHVVQIQPEVGKEFEPAIMECYETVADASKANNTICEVIHTGYKLYDHILKPALVKVIKNN
ncbi:MAG: nucleotide exchange factor GrpE [Mycoplasmoidaceae bacterium]|nr:nucleotide exchange factor GrpE [Mycoplasmoidaceae bacterium]